MRAVGLKVLKNKLSEYVRLAEAGETVLITDREHVVAELVPPRAERAVRVGDAVLADLVRRGLLTPPMHAPGPLGPLPAGTPGLAPGRLLRDLEDDRSDR
jgi:antitoxin (DNA-binding transcriptional repressor) of toxin-antitoxin stability system